MKPLLKCFTNMSIGKKLYFSYLLVVLAPVLIVGLMLMYQISDRTQRGIVENSKNVAAQMARSFSDTFQKSTTIIESLIFDETLKKIVSPVYGLRYDNIEMYNNYNRISLSKNITAEVADIKVFVTNPHMMENGELMQLTPDMKQSDWFIRIAENPGHIHLEYMKMPRVFFDTSDHLILAYYLNDHYNHIEMLILLALNPVNMTQIIQDTGYPVMLVNNNSQTLYANDRNLVGKTYEDLFINNDQHVHYNEEEYYKIELPIEIKGSADRLYLFMLVPLKEMTLAVNRSLAVYFAIIIGCLLFAILLIIIFSKSLASRIKRLQSYTDHVAQGNLDIENDIIGQDEIGQLATDFSVMVTCIRQLMQDNETYLLKQNALQIQHKNAQLRILSNQINPHFLFNTLDTIRMNILREKDSNTAHAIQILAEILRSSLETGHKPILLKNELKTVENYLHLIKYRYGDRFNFSVNTHVDENLPVLPFILQPLVENAVIHGLGNCASAGYIEVTTAYDRNFVNDILITIKDNGVGISEQMLDVIRDKLLSPINEDESKHIGIPNVHYRLQLYYGSNYGLFIDSKSGEGTVITVRIMGG